MNNTNHKQHDGPPVWADRFLTWFCDPALLPEIQGDLHELFQRWKQAYGLRKARWLYAWNVLTFFRPFAIKIERSAYTINHTDMFKNYFKIALRNLRINRLYSFLNITGLAVGLACGILILLWIADEFSYNKFHAKLPNIYLMMKHQTLSGETFTNEVTPGPLAATLRDQIPEVKYAARASGGGQQLINAGKESMYELGIYADPDFFNIMTFPAVAGDPIAALHDPGSVVITERTAKKLFGNQDPMGKIVRHNNVHDLQVAAVVRDVPSNSMIQFDVVLPFRMYEQEHELKWDNNSLLTWVELYPSTNLAELNKKIENILTEKLDGEVIELFAYPFANMHLYSKFRNGKPNGGRIEVVHMLGSIGIFILLIACINFMNLATARSERRAREVGVRKVMGARRGLIIGQFLSEALVMTFLALILSLLLVNLALPIFNRITERSFALDISNWQLWSMLLLLGLFTGIVAGSYPAFFLSRFQPVRVLKGVISSGKGVAILRKGLVTFQFFVSVFMIITTIVIFKQLEYAQNRPLGYDQENLIELPARGDMSQKFEVLKNDLLQISGVKSVSAGSGNLLRMNEGITGFTWPGKVADQDFPITVTWVHYDWTETAGLNIVEGRDFSPEFGSDTLACLLNQTAVERMGLKEPIGTVVGGNSHVIGVVEDFVYNNPTSAPTPMVVFLRKNNLNHFFVRFQNDQNWRQSLAQIEQIVKKHNPTYPFEFHFTKEEYQKSFNGIRSTGQVTTLSSGLAIFISCLGLFGLSAFVAEQRRKEIGIRKVLGATVANIGLSLSRDFLKPVLLSFVLAAPLAGWAMQKLLLSMDYHIELAGWMFALAGVLAVLIALLTVGFQSVKAARANPVDSLRNE